MSRDQRVRDNWALLYAAEAAAKRGVPVAVAFNLVRFIYTLPAVHISQHCDCTVLYCVGRAAGGGLRLVQTAAGHAGLHSCLLLIPLLALVHVSSRPSFLP